MQTIVVAYLFVLAGLTLAYMAYGYFRGKSDLLSLRNFFLLGFVIFQLTSAATAVKSGFTLPYVFQDLVGISVFYCFWATVFLVVFVGTHESGLLSRRIARATPAVKQVPTETLLWILALTLLPIGLALRFVPIPLIGVLANLTGVALLSTAAGIAAWIWARRPFNPATIVLLFTIGVSAIAFALIGEYGRRSLVAVAGCVLWGAYYSRMRYEAQQTVIVRIAILAVPMVVFVALFTAVRGNLRDSNAGLATQLSTVASGDTKEGLMLLLDGQGTGTHSMWLMEHFPGSFEYRPFLSSTIGYFLVYPIPREGFWEEKPDSLSMDIPHLARLNQVNRDVLTIGPGIIGHAAADGGFLFLLLYAFMFGALIRFFDEIVQINALQPLAVIPVGAALGQVLGLPRGETGVFLFAYLFATGSTYFLLLLFGKGLERSGLFYAPGVDPHAPVGAYDHDPSDPDAVDGYTDEADVVYVRDEHDAA